MSFCFKYVSVVVMNVFQEYMLSLFKKWWLKIPILDSLLSYGCAIQESKWLGNLSTKRSSERERRRQKRKKKIWEWVPVNQFRLC